MNEIIDILTKTKSEVLTVANNLTKTRKDINGISFVLGCTLAIAYTAYKKTKRLENEIKELRKES